MSPFFLAKFQPMSSRPEVNRKQQRCFRQVKTPLSGLLSTISLECKVDIVTRPVTTASTKQTAISQWKHEIPDTRAVFVGHFLQVFHSWADEQWLLGWDRLCVRRRVTVSRSCEIRSCTNGQRRRSATCSVQWNYDSAPTSLPQCHQSLNTTRHSQ